MHYFKTSLLSALAVFTVLLSEEARAQHPFDLSERAGLTLLVNVGPGYQHDSGQFSSDGSGLGRVSLGVGDFLKNDLAVFLRFAVTSAEHEEGFFPPASDFWVWWHFSSILAKLPAFLLKQDSALGLPAKN